MPKATHSLLPRSTFATLGAAATMVLARQAAILLVKDELRRRGERVAHVPMRDIHIAADEHLREHPELIAQAAEQVRTNRGLLLNETRARKWGANSDDDNRICEGLD